MPLGINDIETYYNIGEFSLNQGASSTNPYRIIIGPDNDWFIVDAGLNGIVRRERATGGSTQIQSAYKILFSDYINQKSRSQNVSKTVTLKKPVSPA